MSVKPIKFPEVSCDDASAGDSRNASGYSTGGNDNGLRGANGVDECLTMNVDSDFVRMMNPQKPSQVCPSLTTINVDSDEHCVETRADLRKLLRIHHPDKGGDLDEFKKIQRRYHDLSLKTFASSGDELGSLDPSAGEVSAKVDDGWGENLEALREEGDRLLEQGSLAGAVQQYLLILERNSQDSQLCYLCAKILLQLGQHKASEELARRAVAIKPLSGEAHGLLAASLVAAGTSRSLEISEAKTRQRQLDARNTTKTPGTWQGPETLSNGSSCEMASTQLVTLCGHSGDVRSVRLRPNTACVMFASGSLDGTARLWVLSDDSKSISFKCVSQLLEHEDRVTEVEWSTTGTQLATCSLDRTARVWTVDQAEQDPLSVSASCQFVLRGHDGRVTSARFSPDEKLLLTGSTDMTARLWSLSTGHCQAVFRGHQGIIPSVAMAFVKPPLPLCPEQHDEDTRLLAATVSGDGACRLWDIHSGGTSPWQELVGWSEGAANLCAFIPETGPGSCTLLVSCHVDFMRHEARVLLWDVVPGGRLWVDGILTGPWQQLDGFRAKIEDLCFTVSSSNCRVLACCTANGVIRVVEVDTATTIYEITLAHGEDSQGKLPVSCLTFSPGGDFLASAGGDKSVKVWDAEDGNMLHVLQCHQSIKSVEWSPDGMQLFVGGNDGMLLVWSPFAAANPEE